MDHTACQLWCPPPFHLFSSSRHHSCQFTVKNSYDDNHYHAPAAVLAKVTISRVPTLPFILETPRGSSNLEILALGDKVP